MLAIVSKTLNIGLPILATATLICACNGSTTPYHDYYSDTSAPPHSYIRLQPMAGSSTKQCVKKAAQALKDSDFKDIESHRHEVWGILGPYKAHIKCDSSVKVVAIAVIGDHDETVVDQVERIRHAF